MRVNCLSRLQIFLIVLAGLLHAGAKAQPLDTMALPSNSTYHLKLELTDSTGASVGLDRYQGKVVLVTMLYASCPNVCPLIVSTIKLTEAKLSADERSDLRVLLISIDPENDTPELLGDMLHRHHVDEHRWSAHRPESVDLRALAGVLGIKYKQLPNGDFNHSSRITLLDREGVVIASTEQLGRIDPLFLEALKQSLH